VKYVERKQQVVVGFRERNSNLIAAIDRCEVLSPPVDALITPLRELIVGLSIRARLPQIEVAVADNAVALIMRVLDAPSDGDRQALLEFEQRHRVTIYLQPGGIGTVQALSLNAPALWYQLPDSQLELTFLPTDFVQINAVVNRSLVSAALQLLELTADSRVLDLYCGLGNFSLALARHAAGRGRRRRPCTGRACARQCHSQRDCECAVSYGRSECRDISDAPWLKPGYTHVLIDPPRIGARELLPRIAQLAPQRLLYVSCHPATLARDIGILVHEHGFELLAAGVVDMFAHTAHVESVALLASGGRTSMAIEIERKFRLLNETWREQIGSSTCCAKVIWPTQRARRCGYGWPAAEGWLSVKAMTPGLARAEYEAAIAATDANEMLDRLCEGPLIEKWRHIVMHDGNEWEIDEFLGENAGLVDCGTRTSVRGCVIRQARLAGD
jgi:CYTH domain-containing protein